MKNYKILIIVLVLAVIVVGAILYTRNKKPNGPVVEPVVMKTYVEQDLRFQVTYPSDWNLSDELSTSSPCCLFIESWKKKTTFPVNASGTPVETITATVNARIQVGSYDRKVYDPFKAATTTKLTLGGNEFYKGITSNGMEFYLMPRTENTGVGAAIYFYPETPEKYKPTARDIVSTIKLLPQNSRASSTPVTSK
ncbi:MAG: hypothetical protein NT077_01630 [Candidatus Taylorbacteria bacterium]|nr:hypothetical protein [Candidatus Taylorbacteria bacterium]